VRVTRAQRGQIAWGRVDLDAEVPADHAVRAIAAVVDKLDLRERYADGRARGEIAGAPATDPKILLGRWGYATSDGVGSGRAIARLGELPAAYRGLCSGVAVACHRLNDFRSDHGEVFSDLVAQLLARLLKHDLIDLHRVAQDGTRIRASAGAASLRSGETLERLMRSARAHLVELTRATTDPALATPRRWRGSHRIGLRSRTRSPSSPTAPRSRRTAAPRTRPRACPRPIPTPASSRYPTVASARHATPSSPAPRTPPAPSSASASPTADPTRAKPPHARTDRGPHRRPPHRAARRRWLPRHDAIDQATAASVTRYAPVPKPRSKASEPPDPPIDPPLPKPSDSDAVAAWRVRMGTDDAKQIYKERAATAETVNADAKAHRGMAATALRGLAKVTGNACLFALTYNILPLHHRERVATRTLTAERSSSGGCARCRPAPAYTTSSRRSPATELCAALSRRPRSPPSSTSRSPPVCAPQRAEPCPRAGLRAPLGPHLFRESLAPLLGPHLFRESLAPLFRTLRPPGLRLRAPLGPRYSVRWTSAAISASVANCQPAAS